MCGHLSEVLAVKTVRDAEPVKAIDNSSYWGHQAIGAYTGLMLGAKIEIPVNIVVRPTLILSAMLTATALANWPQAAGPNGTWSVPDAKPPVSWSVARNENILWRAPLPNGGQSGIAVWGNRLFLTTFEPYKQGAPKTSATILGHAVDAQT